jgi:hypothetical protein
MTQVTDADLEEDALNFIRAARDFFDAGEGRFSPGYAHYGDLLESAEILARHRNQSTAALMGEVERLREALGKIAAFAPAFETGDWADKIDRQGYNRAGNYAAGIARAALSTSFGASPGLLREAALRILHELDPCQPLGFENVNLSDELAADICVVARAAISEVREPEAIGGGEADMDICPHCDGSGMAVAGQTCDTCGGCGGVPLATPQPVSGDAVREAWTVSAEGTSKTTILAKDGLPIARFYAGRFDDEMVAAILAALNHGGPR